MARHEYTKDTRYLYNSLAASVYDCSDCFPMASPVLEALARGEIDGVRQAFKDGLVAMMCPDLMPTLDSCPEDDEVEFRIIHDGKTIGVIINSEVVW